MSSETPSESSSNAITSEPARQVGPNRTPSVDGRVGQIADLLQSLDEAAAEGGLSAGRPPSEHEIRLVEARLGVASSLFTALRCRHVPTAEHCLRVAIGCSAWSAALDLPETYRVALEMAALLHDVGKIGVPDAVLLKPGRLLEDERAVMARHRLMAVDILSSCCVTPDVIEIVRYSTAWYDGSRRNLNLSGDDLPLSARMLAIVDAFDAMVTDHVYRPARSRERAIAELYQCAGTQFDPQLVQSFGEVFTRDLAEFSKGVFGHWLRAIAGQEQEAVWGFATPSRLADGTDDSTRLFEEKLIENMHDGVVFVDRDRRLALWNTGAERLTGLSAAALNGRLWSPELLQLRDERGRAVPVEECPVARAIESGIQSLTRVVIRGRNEKEATVDLHAIPVRSADGATLGVTVLLQDASGEATLEERCQALQDQAARDPLTGLANRAEFDRLHGQFIEAHLENGLPCSLIITDIDHFKYVNDVYGHQAGDEALQRFAEVLTDMCRSGDVVARYGGEEFVILCADCNNAAAAARAEQIRRKLSEVSFSSLANRSITASFGVTELQGGDTPETMLRRADRALLTAKDQGRNQVVQLGSGMVEKESKRSWWPFRAARNHSLVDCNLVTVVPIEIAAEKLRGFIADHAAKITSTGADHMYMEVSGERAGNFRRDEDRPVPFLIELRFDEVRVASSNPYGFAKGESLQTRVHVTIRPKKDRDRRREQATDRARRLLVSMKSYLMAKEETDVQGNKHDESPGVDVGEPEAVASSQ